MMSKYRKAIKNYSIRGLSCIKKIQSIQDILLDFGARGIGFGYDDQGLIESINFKIRINENDQVVYVPFLWKETAKILKEQRHYKSDEHAYSVAVSNIRDWLDAQLALEATKMVKFEQIFLPYTVTNNGKTVFERLNELPLLDQPTNDEEK